MVPNGSPTTKRPMDAEIPVTTALTPVRGNAPASTERIGCGDRCWSTGADEFFDQLSRVSFPLKVSGASQPFLNVFGGSLAAQWCSGTDGSLRRR